MANNASAAVEPAPLTDYFVHENGVTFAGRHLLVDLWDAEHLTDIEFIEQTLRNAAEAAGATVLDVKLHQFSNSGGVSGVAILAESHISIHTWPERDFAAIDVFMCGTCNPHNSLPTLKSAFAAKSITVNKARRGIVT
ncbi:MAG: adenosylmethionine decarboxylase [Rhodospirillaceae bacterium]|jgi:S-adenosylmethionine decarboxylase|nr:adenosylmethionine decarboxylase [Rhodospirillaceae bacterium]MBT3808653.1 adenosylmethionine decarboxylase [Rhodospirillaceae bacterium]MBT3932316.1 adenosylmethionine decarboxylase [Rhodospirillaceae bacterium]MBT4773963.1 adenosylmethionine decarboxylase [Rhodospirillaceae bacterium]MBT5357530.1 adenosylmethionine decarboxylase [Rhodospirillaceae bacterium]